MTSRASEACEGLGEAEPNPGPRGHVPGDSSMWFFVIGDLFIFGVYFVCYMYYRGQDQRIVPAEPGTAEPGHWRY